jgi:large subunit ribosomal protein L1
MGSNKIKTTDMSVQPDEQGSKKAKSSEAMAKDAKNEPKKEVKKPVQKKERSKRYVAKRSQVDRTIYYPLKDAVALLKKVSYTSFTGTVRADLLVRDQKLSADFAFPHATGQTKKVAIVTDALLADIEAGKLDFDILVTEPAMMPKLAKFARVLGPKGLMPNPKTGTVTKDPAKKAKELAGGKQVIKTEKAAPLIHVVIGKLDMKDEQLIANLETLIRQLNARKILKLVISATMSPGIKVDLSPYIVA